ncbi:MAG TPA: hypothetical protein VI749_02940 [Candidatus Omnitrophota bacterium]|nr:hypothetical protein [Candidatus Omnitrophota bacterium]
MTLFYNPKTRKTHPWVFTVFVIMPLLLTAVAVYYGQQHMKKKMEEEKRKAQTDVFEKF